MCIMLWFYLVKFWHSEHLGLSHLQQWSSPRIQHVTKTQRSCEWRRLSVRTQTCRQSLISLPEDLDQEKKRARLPWQLVFFKEARLSDWCEGLIWLLLFLFLASPERRAEPFIVDSLNARVCFQLLYFLAVLPVRIPEVAPTSLFLLLYFYHFFALFSSFSPLLFLPLLFFSITPTSRTPCFSLYYWGQKFKAGLAGQKFRGQNSLALFRTLRGESTSFSSSWKPPTFLGPFLYCSGQQHAMYTLCFSSQSQLPTRTVSDPLLPWLPVLWW